MKQQVEEERERLIRESKDPNSALNTERNKTYDRLVMVQEDLLHHVKGLRVYGWREGGWEERWHCVLSMSTNRQMKR